VTVDPGLSDTVKQASAERARREHLDAIAIEQTLARCADQIFIDIAGQRQIVIGEGGASMTVHDSSESAARLAAGNWKPAFVAALNAGRIRLATVEDQEAFAARRRERLAPSTGSGRSALKLVPSRVRTPEIHNRLAQMKQLLRNAEGRADAIPDAIETAR